LAYLLPIGCVIDRSAPKRLLPVGRVVDTLALSKSLTVCCAEGFVLFAYPRRVGGIVGRTVRALVALEATLAAMALALADGSEWAPAVRATPHYLA
jgi:hypothetical protein